MAEALFTFADEQEWSTPRLNDRFNELLANDGEHLAEDRRSHVQTEMAHIAFEGLQRIRETNQKELVNKTFNAIIYGDQDTQLTLPGMPKILKKKEIK